MAKPNFKFLALPAEDVKVPPQLKTILTELKTLSEASENGFVTKEALVEHLQTENEAGDNMLRARQPVDRVVSFYQKRMVADGFVEIDKPVAEKKASTKKVSKTKGKTPAPDADPEAEAEALAG